MNKNAKTNNHTGISIESNKTGRAANSRTLGANSRVAANVRNLLHSQYDDLNHSCLFGMKRNRK